MASRIARSIFSSALRASARPTRAAQQLSRRHMSASESVHGSQRSGSDRPWIIGSALIFGPFFLYLLSPSARKKHAQHAIHDDKHDFGIHTSQHESDVEVSMKDDEGTEANVTDSLAASEHEDAPKVGEAVEEFNPPRVSSSPGIENVKDSSEGEVKSKHRETDATADADTSSAEKSDTQEGVQAPPSNSDLPHAAVLEDKTLQEQAEERREQKEAEEKQKDEKAGEA